MPTSNLDPMEPRDIAYLMEPLHRLLLEALSDIGPDAWHAPTVAGAWQVRDVAAHLLDTQLRSLSALRDDHSPSPTSPIESYRDLVRFLNQLNADWVQATRRLSPQVLLDLLTHIGPKAADLYTRLDPNAESRYAVDWAGESASANWMNIGREYTEWWHHQMQIRVALDAPRTLLEARWLEPLLDFSLRALPHTYRDVAADPGTALVVEVREPVEDTPEGQVLASLEDATSVEESSLCWSLMRSAGRWTLWRGRASTPRTTLLLDADTAWQSLFHALSPRDARERARIDGDTSLVEAFFQTRSVMV